MDRRRFLALAGGGTLGMMMPMTTEASSPQIDHFLVLIFLSGGWDTTLCLDPWTNDIRPDEKDLYLEYLASDVFKVGSCYYGPAMAPMKPYLSSCSVINGVNISTSDNGHSAAKLYMTTGIPNGRAGVITSEIDQSLAEESPFGSLYNTSFFTGLKPPKMSGVSAIDRYKNGQFLMAETLALTSGINTHKTEFVDLQKNYAANLPLMQQVGKDLLQNPVAQSSKTVQEAWQAAVCFTHSAARTCFLEILGALDTHANHPKNHLMRLQSQWQTISEIFHLYQNMPFKSGSLFDATTFVVMSEFSRTSCLNSAQGKDHNPLTNSVLMAGKGIRGGMTVGASKLIDRQKAPGGNPYQISMPFDFQTGLVVDSKDFASFISPENIGQTIGEMFSVDFKKYSSTSSNSASLKSLLVNR